MLEFRAHHFLCTLGFEGKGYSPEFVRNFDDVVKSLESETSEGDATVIRVISGPDRICAPCPNLNGETCESEEKIRQLDDAHAKILGLRCGTTLTWGEAKNLIARNMTLEAFEAACAPCAWKSMGACKEALVSMINSRGIVK